MDLVLTDKDYRAMTCRQNLLTNGEDGVDTRRLAVNLAFPVYWQCNFFFIIENCLYLQQKKSERGGEFRYIKVG